MRGDLIFLLSLLSISSVTILYIGSDNSYRYIYGTTETLKRRIRDRLQDVAPKCCEELTKECFACATGLLVEDFCKRHSGEYGCPNRTKIPPNTTKLQPEPPLRSIYEFITNPKTDKCEVYHVLKGENKKEPDVRICMDNIKPPCNVISVGIAYNFIFDKFMLSKGCRVWSYDPSMKEGSYNQGPKHKFFHVGIGGKDGWSNDKSTLYKTDKSKQMKSFQIKTLSTMMKDMKVDFVDVLRIDTEGAEWEIIDSFEYNKIGQLLIEVHMWKKYKKTLYKMLSIPHVLFWSARNKWDNTILYNSMTSVYELGFLLNTYHDRKEIDVQHVKSQGGKYMAISQYRDKYFFIQNKHFEHWKIHNYISSSTSFRSFHNFKKIGGIWDDQKTCLIHNVAFLPTETDLYLLGGTGNKERLDKNFTFCIGHAIGSLQSLETAKTVIKSNPIDTDALPSVVLFNNKYFVYTRLNLERHMSGKRGVRVFILNSLDEVQKEHVQINLPFHSYTQNIVYHNGKFHAFFCSYYGVNHAPYDGMKIAYGVSENGLDFTIIKRDMFPGENIYLVNGYIKEQEDTLVFFHNTDSNKVFYIKLTY